MGDEPKTDSSDLTIREKLIVTVIGVPVTYGLVLLCEHLDGVDESGWVWWPSLIGLVLVGGTTIVIGCSLVWDLILSTGIISGADQVIEWIVKTIIYICIAWAVISLASEIFDGSNNRELLFFALGGYVVYVFVNRDR